MTKKTLTPRALIGKLFSTPESNSAQTDPLFEKYFSSLYGERWSALRDALVRPEKQVLRKNLFLNDRIETNAFDICNFLENCFWRPTDFKILKNNTQRIIEFYSILKITVCKV